MKAYAGGLTITRNGTTTLDYRATDKAGIREPWEHLTLRIDTRGPTISVAASGTGRRRARDLARPGDPEADVRRRDVGRGRHAGEHRRRSGEGAHDRHAS